MGGVSAFLGLLSLLGFLIFLAGVGLVVMSASQGRPVRRGIFLAAAGLVNISTRAECEVERPRVAGWQGAKRNAAAIRCRPTSL